MCLCIIRSQTMWSVNRQRKKRLLINCHYQLFVSLSLLSGHALYSFSCRVCVCTQCAPESWPKSTEHWLLSCCLIVEYKVHAARHPACRHKTDEGEMGQTHSQNEAHLWHFVPSTGSHDSAAAQIYRVNWFKVCQACHS